MVKQPSISIPRNIKVNNKKKETVHTDSLDGSQGNFDKWGEKPVSKVTYCMTLFMYLSQNDKTVEMENNRPWILGDGGWGRGWGSRGV